MNNEKGMSLLEVMAAVAISTIIIGVAIMLSNSVALEWNSSVNKYSDDAKIRLTFNALTKYLSDSNFAYRTGNELRFTTYADGSAEKKSLYLNGTSLFLYNFNSPNLTDNATLSSPGVYTNGILLSDGVTGIQFLNESGASVANPFTYNAGNIVKMNISFSLTKTSLNGNSQVTTVKSAAFKLLQM